MYVVVTLVMLTETGALLLETGATSELPDGLALALPMTVDWKVEVMVETVAKVLVVVWLPELMTELVG